MKNPSIRQALADLLGKPVEEADALCVPTAGYGHPMGSPAGAPRTICATTLSPSCGSNAGQSASANGIAAPGAMSSAIHPICTALDA